MSTGTIGVKVTCVGFMIGMGDALPKEALRWIDGVPDVVMACAKIARFTNDIASFKVCIVLCF